MSYNRRSKLITDGVARSPNRAMLLRGRFTDGDFDKRSLVSTATAR
jgi:hypothetical protein